jgi:hypothetical protein
MGGPTLATRRDTRDFTFFLIYTEKSGKTYFTEIGAAVVPGRNELPAGLEITGTRTFSASG